MRHVDADDGPVVARAEANRFGRATRVRYRRSVSAVLILAPWGGTIADRFPKRKILYLTQAMAGLLALALGILVATGMVRLWMIYVLAALLGLVYAVDHPTRQTFIVEMVGPNQLTNAVSLNSTQVNLARVAGPAIGGALIATAGLTPLFLGNAASYIAVLAGLLMMRANELHSCVSRGWQRAAKAGLSLRPIQSRAAQHFVDARHRGNADL